MEDGFLQRDNDELGFEMTVRYRLLAVRVDDHFRSGVLIDARTLGAL